MDKSKKYIEMCEKAAKDLGGAYDKPPDPSDAIAMEQSVGERNFEVMCGLAMWRRLAPYDPISSDCLIIKLYKQDQLQKMIIDDFDDVQDMFCNFSRWIYDEPYKTAEQLWLAFVMAGNYNKTWNGKEWVNAPRPP